MGEAGEYEGQDLHTIDVQVGGWIDRFVKTPRYECLTEIQKGRASAVIDFFAKYSFSHIGMTPEDWDPSGITECCLEILPEKITAKPEFFQAVAPVLSAFFSFLADEGLLGNAPALASTVAKLDKRIVAAAKDESNWGMAKSLAMAADEAGVDFRDQKAMDQFIAEYNLRLMALQRADPGLPFVPAPSLSAPATPVRRSEAKIGRNDSCPCGSGKKFKKCCGR